MNHDLIVVSAANCKDEDQKRTAPLYLIEYLQALIPILAAQNLIGPTLKASTITSIARNHRSKLRNSFKATDLVHHIASYPSLVVDGFEVRAWTDLDTETGRDIGRIQFLEASSCSFLDKHNKPDPDREEKLQKARDRAYRRLERAREQQMTRIVKERRGQPPALTGLQLLESAQKERLTEMVRNRRHGSEDEIWVEDPELIDHIRFLMGRNLTVNGKTTATELLEPTNCKN